MSERVPIRMTCWHCHGLNTVGISTSWRTADGIYTNVRWECEVCHVRRWEKILNAIETPVPTEQAIEHGVSVASGHEGPLGVHGDCPRCSDANQVLWRYYNQDVCLRCVNELIREQNADKEAAKSDPTKSPVHRSNVRMGRHLMKCDMCDKESDSLYPVEQCLVCESCKSMIEEEDQMNTSMKNAVGWF